MKRQIHLKEIKEMRDFLLKRDFLFRIDLIKFIVDAAVKEWERQQYLKKEEKEEPKDGNNGGANDIDLDETEDIEIIEDDGETGTVGGEDLEDRQN